MADLFKVDDMVNIQIVENDFMKKLYKNLSDIHEAEAKGMVDAKYATAVRDALIKVAQNSAHMSTWIISIGDTENDNK